MANRLARTVKVTCPKCNNPQDSWDRLLFFFFFDQANLVHCCKSTICPCIRSINYTSFFPILLCTFSCTHMGRRQGDTLDLLSVHHRATLTDKDRQPFTLTHTAHLKLPICLTCMFFWTVWKENPHRHRENHTQKDPSASNPWPSYFVCDSTNHCTTMDVRNWVTSQQYNLAGLQLFKPLAHIFLNPLAGATCRNYQSNLIGLTNS